jgi:hypothetical protein
MKKAILIVAVMLAVLPATFARATVGPVTLLISGDSEDSRLTISLSPDGRRYEILSSAPLEVGGNLCHHPGEDPNALVCEAPPIAGFEVNAGGGSDQVNFTSDIPVPVTVRGGPGRDRLSGGNVSDKLVGGPDNDVVDGRRGDDWIFGGPGADKLLGGSGNDQMRGGPDQDQMIGGPGQNQLIQ